MNNISPKISILMPVFNGIKYIKEAVDSVLNQDFHEWELIISDNGSNDGTIDYIKSLDDDRIRIYTQKYNLGIYDNINFLISHSNASIAHILCADDYFLDGALRSIYDFMLSNSECVLSRCWSVGDRFRFSPTQKGRLEGELPVRLNRKAAILAYAVFGNLVGTLSKATFRLEAIKFIGKFDQSYPYAGDFEYWFRVISHHGIYLNNNELIYERIHANQNTYLLNKKNELSIQVNRIIEKIFISISEEDKIEIRRHLIIYLFSPRISAFFKHLFKFDVGIALLSFKSLPLNISITSLFFNYLGWKLNLPYTRRCTQKLFNRILEENLNKS